MPVAAQHFDLKINPLVIAGDYATFLAMFCDLSVKLRARNTKPEDFTITEGDHIRLDPGGMLNTGEPWLEKEIDGTIFTLQASKSDYILSNIRAKVGGTFIPGWRRFFNAWNIVAVPEETLEQLETWVAEVASSDEAMMAELDFELALDKLAEEGKLIRMPRKKK